MKLAVIGSALAGGSVQIVDVLLDDFLAENIRIYDDSESAQGCEVLGIPVVGPLERILSDYKNGIVDTAIIAVGSIIPRTHLYEKFSDNGIPFPNIVSKRAVVSNSAKLGRGNVILPNAYIGPKVRLGNNNYITTATTINHDSSVGSHNYFSTAVSVAGRVRIGNCIRFDSACCVTADAIVEDDSMIGPGESFGPTRHR